MGDAKKTLRRTALGILLTILAVGAYDWLMWYSYIKFQLTGPLAFSAAMDAYPLKGKVSGGAGVSLQPSGESTRYAEALAYAEEMGSDSLLIWQDGELQVEMYWHGHDRELRPESASMHKSIVGLVYGRAIRDGYINSVDDPVRLYIPEWQGEARGDIRLRDILTMSSGIDQFPASENPYSDFRQLSIGMRLEKLMLDLQPARPPGEKFQYANCNSQLLGVILERALGESYHSYLSRTIWAPLDAADAYVWLDRPGGMARTYAGLLARPQDWLKIGLLIKNRGRWDDSEILPASWIDEMTASSKRNPNYGYQIWLANSDVRHRYYSEDQNGFHVVSSEPFVSDDLVYMDGFGGQRVYVSRNDNYVIVSSGQPTLAWDESVLPNIVARLKHTNANAEQATAETVFK